MAKRLSALGGGGGVTAVHHAIDVLDGSAEKKGEEVGPRMMEQIMSGSYHCLLAPLIFWPSLFLCITRLLFPLQNNVLTNYDHQSVVSFSLAFFEKDAFRIIRGLCDRIK